MLVRRTLFVVHANTKVHRVSDSMEKASAFASKPLFRLSAKLATPRATYGSIEMFVLKCSASQRKSRLPA